MQCRLKISAAFPRKEYNERYADMCEKGVDFQVLNSWSFSDILRNLNSDSRKFKELYLDTINQEIPSASTIGNVVDSDEMIRIY